MLKFALFIPDVNKTGFPSRNSCVAIPYNLAIAIFLIVSSSDSIRNIHPQIQ